MRRMRARGGVEHRGRVGVAALVGEPLHEPVDAGAGHQRHPRAVLGVELAKPGVPLFDLRQRLGGQFAAAPVSRLAIVLPRGRLPAASDARNVAATALLQRG